MVKRELISRVAAVLRENDVRKSVPMPKHVFHISDDEGTSKDFVIKETNKNVLYTVEDITAIVDACLYVIQEALKQGEGVSLYGFGRLILKYMKPKRVKNVLDSGLVDIDGHYLPKFVVGNDLRRCAQVYEQSLKDKELNTPLPIFSDEDE